MPIGDGIRRNVAHILQAERDRLRDAFLQLNTTNIYPDGVTYWDKQEDIHKNAHAGGSDVHSGPAFLPWHRELCNRLELLLREVDPELSLHYWDWTTDPRATPDGIDGTVNLFTPAFMGSDQGSAGVPFQNFKSTEPGHITIWRQVASMSPAPVPPQWYLTRPSLHQQMDCRMNSSSRRSVLPLSKRTIQLTAISAVRSETRISRFTIRLYSYFTRM